MPLFLLGIDVFSGNMISKHFLNESILLQFLHCLQKCAGQLIDMQFLTLFFLQGKNIGIDALRRLYFLPDAL